MEYMSVIVNELGHTMYHCCDLTTEKECEILESHPEWHIAVVPVGMD